MAQVIDGALEPGLVVPVVVPAERQARLVDPVQGDHRVMVVRALDGRPARVGPAVATGLVAAVVSTAARTVPAARTGLVPTVVMALIEAILIEAIARPLIAILEAGTLTSPIPAELVPPETGDVQMVSAAVHAPIRPVVQPRAVRPAVGGSRRPVARIVQPATASAPASGEPARTTAGRLVIPGMESVPAPEPSMTGVRLVAVATTTDPPTGADHDPMIDASMTGAPLAIPATEIAPDSAAAATIAAMGRTAAPTIPAPAETSAVAGVVWTASAPEPRTTAPNVRPAAGRSRKSTRRPGARVRPGAKSSRCLATPIRAYSIRQFVPNSAR